jgi:hypothetical protein
MPQNGPLKAFLLGDLIGSVDCNGRLARFFEFEADYRTILVSSGLL